MTKPTPSFDPALQLSPTANQRREQMLHDLIDDMQRIHRARRARRSALLATTPLLLLAMVFAWTRWTVAHAPPPGSSTKIVHAPNSASPLQPAAIITVVQTDATVLDRYRATSSSSAASQTSMLDDAQLLDALANINRPAGLVRTADRVWLTRSVTDEPSTSAPSNSS